MPSVPAPIGRSAAGGPWWTAVLGQITAMQQQLNQLTQGAQQTNTVDQYGNTQAISGQLNQVVTIGASHGNAGVQVGTGLPAAGGSNAGLASQHSLVIGTLTVVANSTAATVASVASGAFAANMMIGAATVKDPSTGIATPALTPGTYIKTISGTNVVLSQVAAESGTALYAAACLWVLL
jgi:hypothetical protein